MYNKTEINNNAQIILFDGVCNLCNGLVRFIIKRDPEAKFRFASLQSESGQSILYKLGLDQSNFDSVIYIKGDNYFIKSSAGLNVLNDIGGIWKMFFLFIIIPKFIRDFFYDIISKSRYKIFGKRESCMIPTSEIKQRFL